MMQFTILFLLAFFAWFWYDAMRARERAVSMGKQACERDGLQFLDETVALRSLRLRRDDLGRVTFRRVYEFEFSDNGNNRRGGAVTLVGREMESIYLEPFMLH